MTQRPAHLIGGAGDRERSAVLRPGALRGHQDLDALTADAFDIAAVDDERLAARGEERVAQERGGAEVEHGGELDDLAHAQNSSHSARALPCCAVRRAGLAT